MTHLTRSTDGQLQRGIGLPMLLVTVSVAMVVGLFMAAGFWQLQRAHYKDQLQALTLDAMREAPIELARSAVRVAELDFHKVHVRGEWVADRTIFIDNKMENHVVGYHVVTPLRITASDLHVLVNRGWVAAPPLRSQLPAILTPSGEIEVSGIARAPSQRFLELSKQSNEGIVGRVWQNLTIERFASWSGFALQPVVIVQQNVDGDGLHRIEVAPEASGMNPDRHRGYALTWFGLAAVTLVLSITAKLQSRKK